ncbi:sushi repeat-containing protein SRPX2-like [Megalops cyprinoides]|uniref:sushi repeat-containing protein SRPX2-like n=1 Tax=Megalops cyprinoides TaxID=118141 RepID=UPI001863CF6A|nr:sushi repeat-containing protein SRPX2-like [Megalops cyprinoides]XP_036404805.1 sushi repeat-containing protein SRPX2-like [Megalops cyprinoides]
MSNLYFLLLLEACTLTLVLGLNNEDSPSTLPSGYNEITPEEETHYTPRLDYRTPRWCYTLNLKNGEVSCFSPRGGNYHNTLGTRCEMSCDRGYRLLGRSSVQCMPNRKWSGTSYCRQVRCRVLPLILHGTYTCTNGVMVDSRCDFTCNPGYRLEAGHSRTCLESGRWSDTEPVCADRDPPKIQCPLSRVRLAEPGKLTARVTWNPPVVKDTADTRLTDVTLIGQAPGSEFEEGIHVVRYKVYDQARNKAACKFIVRIEVRRCPALKEPLHGYLSCSPGDNIYGSICEYHCEEGYERRGAPTRVCQFDRNWSGDAPKCFMMEINTDVRTSTALLAKFYRKRRLLVVSTPDTANQYYKLQKIMLERTECELNMRQVTVIELLGLPPREVGRIKDHTLDSQVIEGLRQALRISKAYFTMVLLDKHGIDRERFVEPTTSEELYSLIDDYLLNEEERERLEKYRDVCD